MDFIKNIFFCYRFVVGNNNAKVGVIKFGASSLGGSHYIPLNSYLTQDALFTAIDNLNLNTLNAGGRNLLDAFARLETSIAANSNPARPVVIVLITTGPADRQQEAIQKAQEIQFRSQPNKYLLVLGVGQYDMYYTQWRAVLLAAISCRILLTLTF